MPASDEETRKLIDKIKPLATWWKLHKLTGIGEATIYQWYTSRRKPTVKFKKQLQKALQTLQEEDIDNVNKKG